MHDCFGDTSDDVLRKLLQKPQPNIPLNSRVQSILRDISRICTPNHKWAAKPARFRVSIPVEDIKFNHELEVGKMWIDRPAVLLITDREARYSLAEFIVNQSSEHIWNLVYNSWITVFNGLSQITSHDQGVQFIASYFQTFCSQLEITLSIIRM